MGCDIHMLAEIKKKYRNPKATPEWQTVGRVFKSEYYRAVETPYMSKYSADDEEYEWNERYTLHPYDRRNYNLFGILANVRNGYGFAGVDTGDGFKPIAMPRGVPEDASTYYKLEVEKWDGDGHSHSYITLQELLEYNWSQVTKCRGVVNKEQYNVLLAKGKPESWCGDVTGQMVKMVANEDMEIVEDTDSLHHYTQVEWEETYADCCREFVDKTIPALQKLAKNKDVLDVRIVFFFDN